MAILISARGYIAFNNLGMSFSEVKQRKYRLTCDTALIGKVLAVNKDTLSLLTIISLFIWYHIVQVVIKYPHYYLMSFSFRW